MAGQGLHPNGIDPALSADLYRKIIIPTDLYVVELWSNMTHCDTNLICRLQHFIAKKSRAFLPALDQTSPNQCWDCITYHATLISWNLTSCTHYLVFHHTVSANNYSLRSTLCFSHDRNAVHLDYIPDICKLRLKYDLLYVVNNVFHNPGWRSIPPKTTRKLIVIKALKVLRDGACGMLVVVKRRVNYSMAFKIDIAIQYWHCGCFMDQMFVMHGYNKQEKRWMLPKCVLSMKVKTYNPTPFAHQVNNSH